MSYLHYSGNLFNYELKFDGLLNLIFDDSSTGKSTFANELSQNSNLIKTNAYSVIINPNLAVLQLLAKSIDYEYIVVIDMERYDNSDEIDFISKLRTTHITFLILGRRYAARLPVAIQNTYKFEICNGVTRNVRLIENNEFYNINPVKTIITEDSKSGYLFFKNIFKNVKSAGSNSNITRSLDINSVVIFDGLGFGAYLEKFLDAIEKEPRYSYICWHSFEYFILENVFNEFSIPRELNLEDAVTNKLRELKPDYSKTIGCTGDACRACSNSCKQSSKVCLKNSKYAKLLELYEGQGQDSSFSHAINKMKQ